MFKEPMVELVALRLSEGEAVRVVSDAIPNRLNESDAILNAETQNLFELGWTHGAESSRAAFRAQSVRRDRMTSAEDGSRLKASSRVSLHQASAARCRTSQLPSPEDRHSKEFHPLRRTRRPQGFHRGRPRPLNKSSFRSSSEPSEPSRVRRIRRVRQTRPGGSQEPRERRNLQGKTAIGQEP